MKIRTFPHLLSQLVFLSVGTSMGFAQLADSSSARVVVDDPDVQKLEAFTVTGSNIARVEAETALPVTVIGQAEIENRGVATMADLMETVAITMPTILSESNTGQINARGDIAAIDLRGLGVGSTLTLVNGRRIAPFPATTNVDSIPQLAVSINNVPASLVSRVEILRDGASAIYGADAAAGVVNSVINPARAGRHLATRFAVSEHGGGNEYGVNVSEGFTKGDTNWSVAVDLFHRDDIFAQDRNWAKLADQRLAGDLPAPWNGVPLVDANGATVRDNDFDNSQSITRLGQFQRGFAQPNGSFSGARPEGNNGIVTSTAPGENATMASNGSFNYWKTASGDVNWKQSGPSRNLDSPERVSYANVNQWRMLLPETDRAQFSLFADHALNDTTELFGDLMYYRAVSTGGYEPINFNSADMTDGYVPAYNPWNPFGERFYHPNGDPNADGSPRLVGTPADVRIAAGVRLPEFRPRVYEVTNQAYRALGGIRGNLGTDWKWETAVMYSGGKMIGLDHNTVRESRFRYALYRADEVAFNPFGYTFKIVGDKIQVDQPYTNPETVLDPLYVTTESVGQTHLAVWDAKLSGELWQLFNGGRIGVAAGAEYRWEAFSLDKSPFFGLNPLDAIDPPWLRAEDNDIINNSPTSPIDSDQSIYSAFAEVALPFVTEANRMPLVEQLELTLAARYEDFSIHGSAAKPKASLVWKPASWLKLRGSYNESYRAPNLAQTNVQPTRRQQSTTDNYRFEATGLSEDGALLRTNLIQGNDALLPEQAESWVAGLVLDVPRIDGMSLTFDYWQINLTDAFANFGRAEIMAQDELFLTLATQAALAAGTPIDQIDLGSGTSAYKGYNVARRPVTDRDRALFAAYNAMQPTAATMRAPVGEFLTVTNDLINLGSRELEGYDVAMQYRLPMSSVGQFILRVEATNYLKRDDQEEDTSPILSNLGTNGNAEWRGNVNLSWRRQAWSANWFTTYYGSYVDTSAATTEAVYDVLGQPGYITPFDSNGVTRYYLKVDPVIEHNVRVAYSFSGAEGSWRDGLTVHAGINNLFDAEPPLIDEAHGYLAGAMNPRGRVYKFGLTKQF